MPEMSSLAAQLAQSASLNTALLVDRSRRKSSESYLFTGREADQHDLESIYALGVNGLLQLASLNPAFRALEDQLFSDHAKAIDRTLLSVERNLELDRSIAACLALLGPYLMETPTGKVIEWLVRRFRINEFNIEAVLSLFLPYHESPHFTKMVTILHIKPNSTWSFLLAYKSAAQNLPRISLVTEMLQNSDVSRFVTSLLPSAMKEGHSHRVLLAFNAACLHDFILRSRVLDEGTLAYLLPALLEPLQHVPNIKDATLGSYILLSTLSQKCQIAPAALKTIVNSMAKCADNVSPMQFTNAILAVCEQQPQLDRFSDGTVKAIVRNKHITSEIQKAAVWTGIEKIICPLLPGLEKRSEDDYTSPFLEAIIVTPNIPNVVVRQSADMLLNIAVATEMTAASASARRLLSIIQQRYPSVFLEAAEVLSQQNEALRESVDQLIISLSVSVTGVVDTSRKDEVDKILASTSADAKVRAIAVKELLTALSNQKFGPSELASVHSALLARAQDTNQVVIEALYSQPALLVPILLENFEAYIGQLSDALTASGSKPKRSLLRAHATFLVSHFCSANTSHVNSILQEVFFPFLLFSKSRQHTADAIWDLISTSPHGLKNHEWLVGCTHFVDSEKSKSDIDPVDRMSNTNIAIASQIARNILKSNNYPAHFDTLLAKLQDPNSHTKVLGYLIIRALLRQLSGEHQLNAARRILDVMGLKEFSGIEDISSHNEFDVLADGSLGKIVVMKPSSRATLNWLQVSIASFVPTIERPAGITLNWIGDPAHDTPDQRGPHYVGLLRDIYSLANASTSVPLHTTGLLRVLFENLKEDALVFLAGIWTAQISAAGGDASLSVVALHHASAFLQAHIMEESAIDFQTILPSLLATLRSSNGILRDAALACITHLSQLADRQFSTVYKFDVVYGLNKNQLQYLVRDDFKRYLGSIMECRDHLAHDADYIKTFHKQHLGRRKADKKRDAEYKHRVLCYVLSHINAVTSSKIKIALLEAIDTISDSAKAHVLLPTIRSLTTSSSDSPTSQSQILHSLLVACLDISAVEDLNDTKSTIWGVFASILRNLFIGPPHLSRPIISRALEHGLFASLKVERKIAICNLLLEASSYDATTYATCKQLLGNLIQEASLIIQILNSLQPNSSDTTPRASKRAKLTDAPEDTIPRLSLFIEVLGSQSLPGSIDLISHLLETLNRVMQSVSPTQTDISYIEQILMSAIENAANNVVEIPNLSPSVIRLDILVELIRVADNPQTFHQALLLIANLSRLAPDSVLHNVMPVFTFMGSNIFHRDDTYSFRVVQQTIDSVVPVMVSSLKSVHSQPLDLYIASKEFLRVFTDAANHIPRHRRTNFFMHLVEVLGSNDFLAPVCMLLIEKVANRVVKQNVDEVQSSLSLPLSILQQNPLALQIQCLTELLCESQRLAACILHPNIPQPTFLDISSNDEHMTAYSISLRRRANALTIFVGYALKPPTSDSGSPTHDAHMSKLVAALISLATLQEGTSAEIKVDDICLAARSSINRALGAMSAMDFIKAVLSMVDSGNEKIQAGALDLLSERLIDVSENVRKDMTPIVIKIITSIQKLLGSHDNVPIAVPAFRAIKAIGSSLCSGEESHLTGLIPQIVAAVTKGSALAPSALAALLPLPSKLGPRIIPYFREIITQSVAIIRTGSEEMTKDSYAILQGLLTSIPTFWGSGELTQIITLYLDHCSSTSNMPSSPMSRLIKTVAKRTSQKTLLPVMVEMWASLKVAPQLNRIAAYFNILTQALRSTTRSVVLDQLRLLFNVFIESFDITKVVSGKGNDAQGCAIASFKELVVKLNEATFRPLFRRLYDWAFAEKSDVARKLTFCRLYETLLDFFKGLMNPYMSFLLEPFIESLRSFNAATLDNQTYWASIIQIITKSLMFDDGAFWRDDKLRQITSPLIEQVAVCVKQNYTDGKVLIQECLSALTDNATDDTHLKTINLDLLMNTRSDDIGLRLLALTCSEALWRAHGGKLLGFVAETTTFIAECSEDENDMVVRQSFKLKDAVESVAGNIDGL